MLKLLKLLIVCSILAFPTQNSGAKELTFKGENDKIARQKSLQKICDSLVLNNNYKEILNVCKPYVLDSNYKPVVTPFLIGALFFTKDTIQSERMLLNELKNMSYLDIAYYLANGNLALIKYFEVEDNRERIILLAQKKYMQAEQVEYKKQGAQIIRFFMNDQRIRKIKYAYPEKSKEAVERRYKILDSIQNDNIYKFYQAEKKYFSEKEVGKDVSALQAIYLSHVTNINLRETFFLNLLESELQKEKLEKETYVNFILRTESFKDPEFWNTINDRLPAIRKKYGLPDNYIFMPF